VMMEGQVPTEASPRVMHTERSGRSPRKSSTIRSTEAVRSLKISFIVQNLVSLNMTSTI
jgi:hypothetical protein